MNKSFRKTTTLLRSVGVRLGSSAFYYSGGLRFLDGPSTGAQLSPTERTPFAILLYHRVNPDADPFFPAVSVKGFDAQIGYLARRFKVRPLRNIIDRIKQGQGIEPLTIAITFDDGYGDNCTFAHPILKKYRVPATIFVATGFIGTDEVMWNDRLAWAVKNCSRDQVTCRIRGREIICRLGTIEEKLSSLDLMLGELKNLTESEKKGALEIIIDGLGNKKPQPARLMLGWSSLRQMAKEGWDVGSHTVSHQILTKVDSNRAAEELRRSKDAIESELDREVDLCAFPNGKASDFDSSIKSLTKEAGYKAALTTLPGMNDRESDFYELHRRSVWEEHLPTLACKLAYLYRRANGHECRN